MPWRSDEPAREAIYRKLRTRIGVQDDCISWLLTELRALQKRVDQLESNRARAIAENAEVVRSLPDVDQPADHPAQ